MQRFTNDGRRLPVDLDMSPQERRWVELVQRRARQVLDYEDDPVAVVEHIHSDIGMILDFGRMDLDAALANGGRIATEIAPARPFPYRYGLGPEVRFWNAIVNLADDVLNGVADFMTFFQYLAHDVSFITDCDGLYARARATCFLPKVERYRRPRPS